MPLLASPIINLPIIVEQPNGDKLSIYVSGNQKHNWYHDINNFTIVRNKDGWYVYAEAKDGDVVPSTLIVGNVNPE